MPDVNQEANLQRLRALREIAGWRNSSVGIVCTHTSISQAGVQQCVRGLQATDGPTDGPRAAAHAAASVLAELGTPSVTIEPLLSESAAEPPAAESPAAEPSPPAAELSDATPSIPESRATPEDGHGVIMAVPLTGHHGDLSMTEAIVVATAHNASESAAAASAAAEAIETPEATEDANEAVQTSDKESEEMPSQCPRSSLCTKSANHRGACKNMSRMQHQGASPSPSSTRRIRKEVERFGSDSIFHLPASKYSTMCTTTPRKRSRDDADTADEVTAAEEVATEEEHVASEQVVLEAAAGATANAETSAITNATAAEATSTEATSTEANATNAAPEAAVKKRGRGRPPKGKVWDVYKGYIVDS